MVAFITERNLTPHAAAAVMQILRESPIDADLDRFCKEHGDDPFVDASTWADDIRRMRPETGP